MGGGLKHQDNLFLFSKSFRLFLGIVIAYSFF